MAVFMITVHEPVPLHPPPDQPAKTEPADGDVVNVTLVPAGYTSVQSDPQLMPAGELVTVPDPVPFFVTVKLVWLNGAGSQVTVR
jgi:hypothetical protein